MSTMAGIQWDRFCGEESTRFAISAPYVRDGMKYATDTCILIWVPTDEPNTETDKRFPMVDKFIHLHGTVTSWTTWPEVAVCSKCHGLEDTETTCDECIGLGTRTCDMGHEHDCDECDGTGKVLGWCGACRDIRSAEQFPCGNATIKIAKYLARKISALPGPIEWGTCGRLDHPLCFTFGENGKGVVMGMDDK